MIYINDNYKLYIIIKKWCAKKREKELIPAILSRKKRQKKYSPLRVRGKSLSGTATKKINFLCGFPKGATKKRNNNNGCAIYKGGASN